MDFAVVFCTLLLGLLMENNECIVLTEEYVEGQKEKISGMFPDQEVNTKKFLEVTMSVVVNQLGPLPIGKSKAWVNNVKFLIDLEVDHSSDDLLSKYNLVYRNFSDQHLSYDQHEHSLIQEEKFNKYKMGDVTVEVRDIDRPSPNGMTPMCDIIMMSDDVDQVKNLIEVFGACPFACSGKLSPLAMAEQLGRTEIAEYLDTHITELSSSTT